MSGQKGNSLSANNAFAETRRFSMRFFTPTALLAAALVSAVIAVPFLPIARLRTDYFEIEARLTSNSAGHLQIYYDDGAGFREDLSQRVNVSGSNTPAVYRLPVPSRVYRA